MASRLAYDAALEKCVAFLQEWEDPYQHDDMGLPYMPYRKQLQDIANRRRRTLDIALDDLTAFDHEEDLARGVVENTRRYISLFAKAADRAMPPCDVHVEEEDIADVLTTHRNQTQQGATGDGPAHDTNFPPELMRRFQVRFEPCTKDKPQSIRLIKADSIGHLVTVKGIVTRISAVKPLMTVATYTCDQCGFEIYQEVTSRTFMPITTCPSQACQLNNVPGRVYVQTRGSKFIKFQEIKIQEMAEQVPIGHIPRTMTIHAYGELTRKCSPGNIVTIGGIFLPVPFTGMRRLRAGLIADTYLEAMSIHQEKRSYADHVITEDTRKRIEEYTMEEGADTYTRLSKSIAPEIFGHDDVKKALLLLLVGGVTRVMPDGMRIRGDLHICLMGDPGVAKSQLLKHISHITPRGVYTTGKGSTGVGLTAAVIKDQFTGELVLEGGALVLADLGICCIDEFDKMDESDRTAIHEVMEQQTVSIAKAGITTSLNARTAILAAANPAYGRYNLKRSPAENINLPAALLSRFDLLYLILDVPDEDNDRALAQHITYVHQHCEPPPLEFDVLDASLMRAFIAQARRTNPTVPRELADYITGCYVTMRQEEQAQEDTAFTYTTARTLLSILRMAQGLARLRLSDTVVQSDVDEALRLINVSKISLREESATKHVVDSISAIYTVIKDYSQKTGRADVRYDDVRPILLSKGFNQNQINQCLHEYEEINVWQVSHDRTRIRFVFAK